MHLNEGKNHLNINKNKKDEKHEDILTLREYLAIDPFPLLPNVMDNPDEPFKPFDYYKEFEKRKKVSPLEFKV